VTEPRSRIVVTAAVIRRGDDYLVTRRQRGVHLEGLWEFPGGKCDEHETLETCLRREIREELDAEVIVGTKIFECTHAYPERIVELHFFDCQLIGNPSPVLGQEMRWVPRADLRSLQFPPADDELIALLS
jgi:8-oxo-dGTP diphosphatase